MCTISFMRSYVYFIFMQFSVIREENSYRDDLQPHVKKTLDWVGIFFIVSSAYTSKGTYLLPPTKLVFPWDWTRWYMMDKADFPSSTTNNQWQREHLLCLLGYGRIFFSLSIVVSSILCKTGPLVKSLNMLKCRVTWHEDSCWQCLLERLKVKGRCHTLIGLKMAYSIDDFRLWRVLAIFAPWAFKGVW